MLRICGRCCLLADLVSAHPAVCALVESMVEEIVQAPVRERCDRTRVVPACRFLVSPAGAAG